MASDAVSGPATLDSDSLSVLLDSNSAAAVSSSFGSGDGRLPDDFRGPLSSLDDDIVRPASLDSADLLPTDPATLESIQCGDDRPILCVPAADFSRLVPPPVPQIPLPPDVAIRSS
jgi:hypothetical protein